MTTSHQTSLSQTARRLLCVFMLAGAVVCSTKALAGSPTVVSSGFETWEEISRRWSHIPAEQLRQVAQAGKADAQFYLARTELQAGWEEHRLAYDQWTLAAATNTARSAAITHAPVGAQTNWAGIPEQQIRQAAVAGDYGAQRYLSRLGAEKAAERGRAAFEWLKKAAAQSFVPAEYELAVRYLGQSGWVIVPPDTKEGLKWLRQAAAAGFPSAQNRLAEMLIRGEVVAADLPAAITLLQQAADGGSARAQFNLAVQYAVGHGDPRNAGEMPVALFRKAAEAGVPEAQFAFAERCRMGMGVAKDCFEAAAWYRKAAASDQLDRVAQGRSLRRILSLVNERGEITRADDIGDPPFVEAFQLYFKAIELRDADSQCKIADFYLRDREAEHYAAKAYFWYSLAAPSSSRAVAARDRLKAALNTEDHQRVARWIEEYDRPPK